MADLRVLLTPRPLGGHETALFGWLADAVRDEGLAVAIDGLEDDDGAVVAACRRAGLERQLVRRRSALPRARLRRASAMLARLPAGTPVLLAPGVLHAQAWLLASALLHRCRTWVYVPMAWRAADLGWRAGGMRDRLLQPLLQRVDGWITVDDAQRQLLQNSWRVQAPVHVLPNCARVGAVAAPSATPSPDGRLRVAYVGRFAMAQKGLDWLAATLRDPAQGWTRQCHWRFQGAGDGEAALLTLASALGPHRVQVHPHGLLAAALAASDVLVLPSRYEGLPLVALEATACGWPVVASRSAGLQRLLPATSLFDFGDAAGFSGALLALADPAARAAAVAAAQSRLAEVTASGRYRSTLTTLARTWRNRP